MHTVSYIPVCDGFTVLIFGTWYPPNTHFKIVAECAFVLQVETMSNAKRTKFEKKKP